VGVGVACALSLDDNLVGMSSLEVDDLLTTGEGDKLGDLGVGVVDLSLHAYQGPGNGHVVRVGGGNRSLGRLGNLGVGVRKGLSLGLGGEVGHGTHDALLVDLLGIGFHNKS